MANRYWIGTDGVYSTVTNWSETSGGASVGAKPAAGDDVYFDGAGDNSDAEAAEDTTSTAGHKLYWVAAGGEWDDPQCWSMHDRGPGGDGPPDKDTDVFFCPRKGERFDVWHSSNTPGFVRGVSMNGEGILEFHDSPAGQLVVGSFTIG